MWRGQGKPAEGIIAVPSINIIDIIICYAAWLHQCRHLVMSRCSVGERRLRSCNPSPYISLEQFFYTFFFFAAAACRG